MINIEDSTRYPVIESARSEFLALTFNSQLCCDQSEVPPDERYVSLPWDKAISEKNWEVFLKKLNLIPGFIGAGRERIVAQIPERPDRVLSVFHEPKDWFYLKESVIFNRILRSIFPNNFPEIYRFFGCNRKVKPTGFYYTGYWVEKIEGSVPISNSIKEGVFGLRFIEDDFHLSYEREPDRVEFPFKKVLTKCAALNIPLEPFGFDPHRTNFILSDGGEYYLDTLHGPSYADPAFFLNWNARETIRGIRDLNIPQAKLGRIINDIRVISGQEV